MRIVFSRHAELKIAQRKLSRGHVQDAVLHPDFRRPGYRGREQRFKKFGKNFMKVIVIHENRMLIIVTAHWVAKPGKK
jgi:hypothetical protein